jgi:adenine-specific DNA-methyltransferase
VSSAKSDITRPARHGSNGNVVGHQYSRDMTSRTNPVERDSDVQTPRAIASARTPHRARPRISPRVRPSLEWVGKDDPLTDTEVVVDVVAPGDNDQVLLVGDNADGLRALLDERTGVGFGAGPVKLAYLDPPYNTGKRFGHYDDALHSAHWLTDLRARLYLIKELLHPDGSVWLHLDDSEQHHGRCVLDEVFGADAFVATVIWQRRMSRDNRTAFSVSHDYIHVYAPVGQKRWKHVRNGFANEGGLTNPDNDPRGPWRSIPLSAQAGHGTPSQFYAITTPTGSTVEPPPGRCWTYTAPRFRELESAGLIYWPRGGAGRPRLKRYADELTPLAPTTIWTSAEVGDNAVAKKELLEAVGGSVPFDTPKPEALMSRIIEIATDPGDTVLDPYLGSGTTAVAARRLSRRWIGIESVAATVRDVTLPRLTHQGGLGQVTMISVNSDAEWTGSNAG